MLQSGQPKTTRQIIREAGVCAVNSIVAELRANGIVITCRNIRRGIFRYTLINPAAEATEKKE